MPAKKKKKVAAKPKAKAKKKVVVVAKAKKKKVVVAKKKVAAKPKAKKAKKKVAVVAKKRRDATGHLDKKYAKELHERSGPSSRKDVKRTAFSVRKDAYAQELGAEVVEKANSGEDEGEDAEDAVDEEESGGPFVETTGRQEFADGVDESNPEDAEREPFPTT